ncbi:BEM_collapsed_G0045560.mRNA.1.CDS.1 [Saccharomyces cerevisiae]|nr:BEM_collapsed_G0045560.mRNA.1.CDS.1 [Saccharomyces cerevisiae]
MHSLNKRLAAINPVLPPRTATSLLNIGNLSFTNIKPTILHHNGGLWMMNQMTSQNKVHTKSGSLLQVI